MLFEKTAGPQTQVSMMPMQTQLQFPVNPMPTVEAVRPPRPLPAMVSKAALRRHFDISDKLLRSSILTDNVLMAAGCVWRPEDAQPGQRAVQFLHRLPPSLTQMVYLAYNITELLRQKGK